MRIIAGDSRGTKLESLPGDATRPTLERVKEAMFSSVQFLLPGARVLDLYAGSGQLGLEALSRGAVHCTFVDEAPAAAALIAKNAQAAGLAPRAKVVRGNVEAFLAREGDVFDIILLDPPYGKSLLHRVLPALGVRCAEGAVVLCEHEIGTQLPERAGDLSLKKQYRYGTVAVARYEYMLETPTL